MDANNRNVCIVAHGIYPAPRKYREAMALRDGGYEVDVLCIKWLRTDKSNELYEEVNIFRLPIVKKRSSKLRYILEYSLFFLLATIKLNLLYLKKRYSIIQVHSMPEFVVFTALLTKLFGSKIILDVQDPTREVFIAKYTCKETNIMIRIAERREIETR